MNMDQLNKYFKRSICSLFIITLFFTFFAQDTQAFSDQVIQRGATGDDVIELQARLQNYGYYHGTIDGVFGWNTYWAVRNFQHDFGLEVDGLVGDELKKKLEQYTHFDREYVYSHLEKGKDPDTYGPKKGPEGLPPPGQRDPGNLDERAQKEKQQKGRQREEGQVQRQPEREKAPAQPAPEGGAAPQETPQSAQRERNNGHVAPAVNIPAGFSENDIQLMANAVYGEARGEPYIGQVAIAAVIINRVNSAEFPNTVSGVIFEPRAFTAVADGQIWLQPDETSRRAVMDAINGWDPTGGLTHYYNPATATSQWMFNKQPVKRIGKHLFVR